ncbi:hypothetical protein B0H17DRAFT_1144162 [Mycena rosella]|uniref:Uncharacterized protein n=1 Tax=Mycena rosella TaxID=1033263 RepID=A0AAD7CTZ0_MYCRO|nr:hypothetical protein B0H17DRAFT_1144162 [Mycena rosella]
MWKKNPSSSCWAYACELWGVGKYDRKDNESLPLTEKTFRRGKSRKIKSKKKTRMCRLTEGLRHSVAANLWRTILYNGWTLTGPGWGLKTHNYKSGYVVPDNTGLTDMFPSMSSRPLMNGRPVC